jgi:hypothetical protein
VPAEHVAQQGPEVVADVVHERAGVGLRGLHAGDDRALQGDRVRGALGQRRPLLGHRTDRRQPLGQAPAGRPLRLEQGPQGQQVVGQRTELVAALTSRLEPG